MLKQTGALVVVLAVITSSGSASARARRPHLKAAENAAIAQLMLQGSLASPTRFADTNDSKAPVSNLSSGPMVAEDLYRPR